MTIRSSRIIQLVILLCVFQFSVFDRPSYGEECGGIHIVMPETRSGTFYLAPHMDKFRKRYPRAGYLPVGTLLRLTKPGDASGTSAPVNCDGDGDFSRCIRASRHSIAPYLRFTASNGAEGWVAQRDTKALVKWMKDQTGTTQCHPGSRLLIPIGITDTDAMKIYRIDERDDGKEYRSANPVKKPTRSAPWLVLEADGNKLVNLRLPDHTPGDALKEFLRVVWVEPLGAGGSKERTDTVVPAEDRNVTFAIVPLPAHGEGYRVVEKKHDNNPETFLQFLQRFVTSAVDRNTLRKWLQKECQASDISVQAKIPEKLEAWSPIKISGNLMIFEAYRAYEVRQVKGVVRGKNDTLEVVKVLKCAEKVDGPLRTYDAATISFLGIDGDDAILTYWQHDLLQDLGTHFRSPIASGVQRDRGYMLGLKKEKKGVTDPYTAYRTLRTMIDEELYREGIILSSDDRERLLHFVINLIVSPKN